MSAKKKVLAIVGSYRKEGIIDSAVSEFGKTDYLIIGAPVNLDNVNALARKFMERCIDFDYWLWGSLMPKIRKIKRIKRVVWYHPQLQHGLKWFNLNRLLIK